MMVSSCRKHLRSRRLVAITQLGADRIVDLQFGSEEAAYHLLVELYDRGNIVLTDYEYMILNLLRFRSAEADGEDVRFAVRERYPVELAKPLSPPLDKDRVSEIIASMKNGEQLKRSFASHIVCGPAVIEHCLIESGLPEGVKIGQGFDPTKDMSKLVAALAMAEKFVQSIRKFSGKGYIIQKKENKVAVDGTGTSTELLTYDEFQPFLFAQHVHRPRLEFDSFDRAVDEFFSKMESQKIDLKALHQEKQAMKKLDNVREDHEQRLENLQLAQAEDRVKAELVELNLSLVEQALRVMQAALASQLSWTEVEVLLSEAQDREDPVACAIHHLRLDKNHITMALRNPYQQMKEEDGENDEVKKEEEEKEKADKKSKKKKNKHKPEGDGFGKPVLVDLDLGLSAFANSKRFYDLKRHAARKEQKTIEASEKAFKSAEKKTWQTLKEVRVVASIQKARKVYWFEKFLWFISSENFLVIAGRDQQQNELIVKRYLRAGDLYLHADVHGATSCVLKNDTGNPVPPRTLTEAGTFSVCHSAAWEARVVVSAWWVHHDQVSKTAPTGEYLTTGSFMVRGKKNYLPPSYLIMGYGFLFKVDETCIFRHAGERRVKIQEESQKEEAEAQEEGETLGRSGSESSSDEGEEQTSDSKLTENEKEGSQKKGQKDEKSNLDEWEKRLAEHSEGEESAEEEAADEEEEEEAGGGELQHEKQIEGGQEKGMTTKEHLLDDIDINDTTNTLCLSHINRMFGSRGEDEATLARQDTRMLENAHTHKHLSAKERREMKKKKKEPETGSVCEADSPHLGLESERVRGKEKPPASTASQQPLPLTRAQKSKQKKMQKYKDQDEEERELRMKLLGSVPQPHEEKSKKGKKGNLKYQATKGAQKGKGRGGGRPQKGGPEVGHPLVKSGTPVAPLEEVSTLTEVEQEDKVGEDPEQEAQVVDVVEELLASLTGQPHAEDRLMFSVPVCAPYTALSSYKYKVKLTPGTQKKGKACKTALHNFLHVREALARERDLLKVVKDNDLSRNMPGKVKVSAPNLTTYKRR
uniref:ribosome quality control complex subunit NEMF isoform X2 n=1 Tax=Myxine glutinosa TaxID=7769 RepID=UPI00358FD816